ncbi:hypothetical protein ACFRAU_25790 [Arthrobacter sp. NPDC056691]
MFKLQIVASGSARGTGAGDLVVSLLAKLLPLAGGLRNRSSAAAWLGAV